MTECQGCGAWNETSRTLCVLCGTPLAATDEWETTAEPPPLPPLPDGGLSASMPAWLRQPPREDGSRKSEVGGISSSDLRPPPSDPLGPRADPRTFLSDDDFPRWLRDLAAREAQLPAPAAAVMVGERSGASPWPEWPGPPAAATAAPAAMPQEGQPLAVAPARALEERRARAPWETLLLVILFLGVIVAALWALVSNGVFSPGL